MSHTNNTLIQEYRRDFNQGAYKPEIKYPEGCIFDGISIINETFLEREAEKKEQERFINNKEIF